jgi:hypothetical protein
MCTRNADSGRQAPVPPELEKTIHRKTFSGKDEIPPGTFRGGDEIPPGTFRGNVIYRTKDGRADYGFSVERQSDGSHRAYITSQPSYQGRDADGHSTHRLSEGGRPYVCWDRPLNSERDTLKVAAEWADRTQDYIRTGRTF